MQHWQITKKSDCHQTNHVKGKKSMCWDEGKGLGGPVQRKYGLMRCGERGGEYVEDAKLSGIRQGNGAMGQWFRG